MSNLTAEYWKAVSQLGIDAENRKAALLVRHKQSLGVRGKRSFATWS